MTDPKEPSRPDPPPIDPASVQTGASSAAPERPIAPPVGHSPSGADEYGPPPEIETSTGDIYAIADGETRSLDPKYIPMQRVSRSIGAVILSGAAFFVVLVISLVNGFSWVRAAISFGVWGLLTTLLSIWVLYWPTVRYRHMSYQVDREGFRFREGVFWQSSVSVPKTRIQHTDVSQGPIERHFGLSTLIVHTAGTQHASVSLDGLRHENSLKIRDFLLEESKAAAANGDSGKSGDVATGHASTSAAEESSGPNDTQTDRVAGRAAQDASEPAEAAPSSPHSDATPPRTPGEDHGD